MNSIKMVTLAVVALALAGASDVRAEPKHGDGEKRHAAVTPAAGQMKMEKHADEIKKVVCTAPVHLTAEAEKKLGGALYTGRLPKAAIQMSGMKMGAMPTTNVALRGKPQAQMKGAHGVHGGLRGGQFIMVPNQLHHMEVVYTIECGFQVFLYNGFTEPISVDRFQAFILILPEGGDQFFEVMRFLTPSSDGGVLQTAIAHNHDNADNPKGMFEVELYMKFPEDVHPRKFDLIVGSAVK